MNKSLLVRADLLNRGETEEGRNHLRQADRERPRGAVCATDLTRAGQLR